ncbi:prepilin-type N-terminal cleavage/methylation domain-containing protein [Thalassotalea sp. M1531]|uniref:Type II secretion system protein H n=1 Tax=Thalassotalea algicola TaxID=2716224 RepID=A0A7Y0LAF8_9GAMM|nr:GspH/FimT family pseudopilin [Thalassotalea algicola]NMP30943.1 prepilin-type N-terminal cleavage/methylation domain-containing protein [Thalassotalea algicola]
MANHLSSRFQYYLNKGFTLIELMVGIAIVAIVITIGVPALNDFNTQMRVDNQISEVNRLLLTARNAAINTESNVTVCPLKADNTCGNDWTGQISVFTNTAANTAYDAVNERLITVKDAVRDGDKLTFAATNIVYGATGQMISATSGLIGFCPSEGADLNRGLVITASGRVATTSDTDNDGKDETRAGDEVSCS